MTHKKRFVFATGVLALSALFLVVSTSVQAATYNFVDTSGNLRSVTADSSAEALLTASNIGLHSGVILSSGIGSETVSIAPYNPLAGSYNPLVGKSYMYINTSGIATVVDANTSTQAFYESNNISSNSGVMLINSQSDANVEGSYTSL
jgi:hypothetical protein